MIRLFVDTNKFRSENPHPIVCLMISSVARLQDVVYGYCAWKSTIGGSKEKGSIPKALGALGALNKAFSGAEQRRLINARSLPYTVLLYS